MSSIVDQWKLISCVAFAILSFTITVPEYLESVDTTAVYFIYFREFINESWLAIVKHFDGLIYYITIRDIEIDEELLGAFFYF